MLAHSLVSGSQKINLFLPVDKTNMGHLVDKLRGLVDHSRPYRMRPKLFGLLKFRKNLNRLVYFNLPIFSPVRGVGDFTDTGMPGPCIIPPVGTFLRQFFSHLIKFNSQLRV